MAPRSSQYDDESDESSWDEDWDDDLDGEDDEKSTVPCPYCRQPVYEDAEYCSNCEEYISLEDAPPETKPLWIVVTTLVLLGAILFWFL